MTMSNNWKNIGPLSNIPVRGARRLCLKHEGRPVAVFRTGEDEVFALLDECPHKKGPLSEGIVSGRTVTCPLHGAQFNVTTGEVLHGPARDPLKTYRVTLEGEIGRVNAWVLV